MWLMTPNNIDASLITIWVFVVDSIDNVVKFVNHKPFITINFIILNVAHRVSFVYSSEFYRSCCSLWPSLLDLAQSSTIPWLVFNYVGLYHLLKDSNKGF